jgi:hypothetical protein
MTTYFVFNFVQHRRVLFSTELIQNEIKNEDRDGMFEEIKGD